MKQSEIIVGESYLFANTDVQHRKNMIGQVVTVVGKKKGKRVYKNHLNPNAITPCKFKLSNGQYANAGNLKPTIHA